MPKRRQFLINTGLGLGALSPIASFTAAQGEAAAPASQLEVNKRLLRDRYAAAQRQAVPDTLPGAVAEPPVAKADPGIVISCQDPPGGIDEPQATIAAIAGWHAQSVGPAFTSYGPMIAEGDAVVEEWETYFHGADGTLYSNQYCWVKTFRDGKEVNIREYLDSHHAYVVLGLHGPWKELDPPRQPRRRWRPMRSPDSRAATKEGIETVFPVRLAFDLEPAMLRDPSPVASPKHRYPDTAAGSKAIVQAFREAQAAGNQGAVNRLLHKDYRHFMAGEGPLGWHHLPLEELYAPLVTHLASPLSVRYGPMIAENGSVFEEMDILATLDDGTVYNNWHCFIHEVRDGLIVQTREYLDTHHLWVVLGRWAAWGRTPVPPMTRVRRSNLPTVTATFQSKNPFLDLERWQPL